MTCVDTTVDERTAESPEFVVLRDGSTVFVRPIRASDSARLADGFARLSPVSRRFRFLAGKDKLTVNELRYLTDVDQCDHVAIGAVEAESGRGVGIARFVRSAHDPHSAEVAVTVVDEWHRRGLGTELLARVAMRAREARIHVFTALVAIDNLAMIGLLRGKAGVELTHIDSETVEYEVSVGAFAASLTAASTQ